MKDSWLQTQKYRFFIMLQVLCVHLDCHSLSCQVFVDISCTDACLLSYIMERDGTLLLVLKTQNNTFAKTLSRNHDSAEGSFFWMESEVTIQRKKT